MSLDTYTKREGFVASTEARLLHWREMDLGVQRAWAGRVGVGRHSNHLVYLKDTSQHTRSRKKHSHQPTHHPRTSTLAKLSLPVGRQAWPCGLLLFPQMSAPFGSYTKFWEP